MEQEKAVHVLRSKVQLKKSNIKENPWEAGPLGLSPTIDIQAETDRKLMFNRYTKQMKIKKSTFNLVPMRILLLFLIGCFFPSAYATQATKTNDVYRQAGYTNKQESKIKASQKTLYGNFSNHSRTNGAGEALMVYHPNSSRESLMEDPPPMGTFSVKPVKVAYTALDQYGAVTNCNVTVEIKDDKKPEITQCPAPRLDFVGCDTKVINTPNFSSSLQETIWSVFYDAPNNGRASDNCGIEKIKYKDSIDLGNNNPLYIVVIRTWYVIDSSGNEKTCPQTLRIEDKFQVQITAHTNITCFGANDGTATVTVTGAVGTVTYNWQPSGKNTQSVTGLAPGKHVVTVTDLTSGCVKKDSITITEPTELTLELDSVNSIFILCDPIATNGSLKLIAGGGSGDYEFQLNSGPWQVSPVFSPLGANSYSIAVRDKNNTGCTLQKTFTIHKPLVDQTKLAITIDTVNGKSILCKSDDTDGSVTITVSGGTKFKDGTYSILVTGTTSGTVFNGRTTSPKSLVNLKVDNYTVTVKDSVNCDVIGTFRIKAPQEGGNTLAVAIDTVSGKSILCKSDDTDGSVTITVSGGTKFKDGTYSILVTGTTSGTVFNGRTTSPKSLANLKVDDYTVTVTDSADCDIVSTFRIKAPLEGGNTLAVAIDTVSGKSILCKSDDTDGSVTITVSGGTKFKDGTYSILVTGTTSGAVFNGRVTSPKSLANLKVDDYTVTVKDSVNCDVIGTFRIKAPLEGGNTLAVAIDTVSGKSILCKSDDTDGSVTITVSGGTKFKDGTYSILVTGTTSGIVFNGRATSPKSLANLKVDDYSVTVKDSVNCDVIGTFRIKAPQEGGNTLAVAIDTVSGKSILCKSDDTDGSVTITVSGGSKFKDGTYSILVTGTTSGAVFNGRVTSPKSLANLKVDDYTVTVTDSADCDIVSTFRIKAPLEGGNTLAVDIDTVSGKSILCKSDDTDGSVTITVSGGSKFKDGTYSILVTGTTSGTVFNGRVTSPKSLANLKVDDYTVTVKDSVNCDVIGTFRINAPLEGGNTLAVAIDTVSGKSILCKSDDTDGSVTITVSGGSKFKDGTYSILVTGTTSGIVFNGRVTSPKSLANLKVDDYTVTVTDSADCDIVSTFRIKAPLEGGNTLAVAIDTVSGKSILCKSDDTDGSVTITVSGGTKFKDGTYSILVTGTTSGAVFNGRVTSPKSLANLKVDDYTVTVKDSADCDIVSTFRIKAPLEGGNTLAVAIDTVSGKSILCKSDDTDGSVTITVSGGTKFKDGTYSILVTGTTSGIVFNGRATSPKSLANLKVDDYTVTVKDSVNCDVIGTFRIKAPQEGGNTLAVAIDTVSGKSILCKSDDTDGSVTITVSGGTKFKDGTYSILVTGTTSGTVFNGRTTSPKSLANLKVDDYTVTVKDSVNCDVIGTFRIKAPLEGGNTLAVAIDTVSGKSILCKSDDTDGSVTITVSGGSKFKDGTYSILVTGTTSGTVFNGRVTSPKSLANLKVDDYTVTVTDSADCDIVSTFRINAPLEGGNTLAVDIDTVSGKVNLCSSESTDGSVTITVSGGTKFKDGTYSILVTGTTSGIVFNGHATSPKQLTGLKIDEYTVTITDSVDCTITDDFRIKGPEGEDNKLAVAIDTTSGKSVLCKSDDTDGSVIITVTGGLTYLDGTYSILVTGTTSGAVFNGRATSPKSLANLKVDDYTVTVKDSADCDIVSTFRIKAPLEGGNTLAVDIDTVSGKSILCKSDDTDGSVTITVSGGSKFKDGTYSILVTGTTSGTVFNGRTTSPKSLANLKVDDYTVTVKDSVNCDVIGTFRINAPLEGGNTLAVAIDTVSGKSILCKSDDTDGSVTITVSGGTKFKDGTYSILVTGTTSGTVFNGRTTSPKSLANLKVDNYTVTVTDSADCDIVSTFRIKAPISGSELSASIDSTVSQFSVCTTPQPNTTSVKVDGEGGTPFSNGGYKYSLKKGLGGSFGTAVLAGTDSVFTNLTEDTYWVKVIDSANCEDIVEFKIVGSRANVSLTKTIDADSVSKGDFVNFTIKVKNNGPCIAENIEVRDTMSSGYDYQSFTTDGIHTNVTVSKTPSDTVVIWNIPTLNAGVEAELIITAQVRDTGLVYSNTAYLKSDNGPDTTGTIEPPITYLKKDMMAVGDVNIYYIGQQVPVYGNVSTNDYYKKGTATVRFEKLDNPATGTVTFDNNTGEYAYKTNRTTPGIEQFRYALTVTEGNSTYKDTATVVMKVINNKSGITPIQVIAINDNYKGVMNDTIYGNLFANDFNPGASLSGYSYTFTSMISGLHYVNQANGTFKYIPDSGYYGKKSITYEIKNGAITDVATLTLHILPTSKGTITVDDANYGIEDTDLTTTVSLLTNDHDPLNKVQTINTTPLAAPKFGTVQIHANGTYTYKPNKDFYGGDNFVYEITNADGKVDSATAYIVMLPVDKAPQAMDDINVVFKNGTTVSGNVLTNDFENHGKALKVTTTLVSQASHASVPVVIHANGDYTYKPANDWVGEDRFKYEVTCMGYDGISVLRDTATVVIMTINREKGVLSNPLAINDNVRVAYNSTNNTFKLMPNDDHPDGISNLRQTMSLVNPQKGTHTLATDGTLNYAANSNAIGKDVIQYQLSDNQGKTDKATIGLFITPDPYKNATYTMDDAFLMEQDSIFKMGQGNLLINDNDPNGHVQKVSSLAVRGPQHASSFSLDVSGNGNFEYTPQTGFIGTDWFVYEVVNALGSKDSATVYMVVMAPNPKPEAINDTIYVYNGTTQAQVDITANDYCSTPTPGCTWSVTGGSTIWTVTNNANGSDVVLNLKPNQSPNCEELIRYRLTDQAGDFAEAYIVILLIDTIPPVFVAPKDTVVYLAADCSFNIHDSITGTPTNLYAKCSGIGVITPTFRDSIEDGNCPGNKVVHRKWSSTNNEGITTTLIQVITIKDTLGPKFLSGPSNIHLTPAFGSGTAIANWTEPVVIDDCSGVKSLTSTHESGSDFPAGRTPVVYTAIDSCENKSEYVFYVIVNDNQPPIIDMKDTVIVVCQNEDVYFEDYFTANDNVGIRDTQYVIDGGIIATSPRQFNYKEPFAAFVTITVTDVSGLSTSTVLKIKVRLPVIIEPIVKPVEYKGRNEGSIVLVVTGGEPPYTYKWEQVFQEQYQLLEGTDSVLSNLYAGTYQVTVTDSNGCPFVAEMIVPEGLITPLIFPTAFSPNGDGKNDYLEIKGIEEYAKNELTVLNRWGTIVYRKDGYKNTWDGTNDKGKPLPDGTYYYILTVPDYPDREIRKFLYLKREN